MAQKKAHEVEAWLTRPDPKIRIVLLYGSDHGLVAERARRFADSLGLPLGDPFTVVKLDAAELEADPGRLFDEARTVAMFGDQRLIWIRHAGSQKGVAEAVVELAARPPEDAVILVEAGDLRKSSALRSGVEKAAAAMALPCYPDEERSVDRLIDEVFTKEGIAVAPDVRRLLRPVLGADRMASRGELEKLALYCHGRGRLTAEDVDALVGDVSALSADDIVDRALSGDVAGLDAGLSKISANGSPVFLALSAAMRQLQQLHLLRSRMDTAGISAADAVAGARPPIFFSRRRVVEASLQHFDARFIARALERLQAAVLETRKSPALAMELARAALLAIGGEAARRARR